MRNPVFIHHSRYKACTFHFCKTVSFRGQGLHAAIYHCTPVPSGRLSTQEVLNKC